MAQAWPGTLPIYALKASFIEAPIDAVLRSPVDVGLPMLRNRYTTELFLVSWRMQMTKTQVDILFDWYHNTLGRVLTFDFTDQLTLEVREFRFAAAPVATNIGNEQFSVQFNVESV